MKRKITVSLVVIFLFALATILYGDGNNTSPDIIRFGFPFPFRETYTGKSYDPNLQRENFFLYNLIGDLIVLGVTIFFSNLVLTAWIRRSNSN
ncbi:hypothetical protein SAMN06265348_12214 [Pedobacter westerhofensis]|uniref:Uncharacterized protein n=1 Tax=Pedobacter westerhofensis TaxID=425512 RepID=A0A521FUY1_9SPHI|nr:hypothetical protein SAMN06265348_12214 [Pedobacter westerhofensis]